jgi:hypothetical protein
MNAKKKIPEIFQDLSSYSVLTGNFRRSEWTGSRIHKQDRRRNAL